MQIIAIRMLTITAPISVHTISAVALLTVSALSTSIRWQHRQVVYPKVSSYWKEQWICFYKKKPKGYLQRYCRREKASGEMDCSKHVWEKKVHFFLEFRIPIPPTVKLSLLGLTRTHVSNFIITCRMSKVGAWILTSQCSIVPHVCEALVKRFPHDTHRLIHSHDRDRSTLHLAFCSAITHRVTQSNGQPPYFDKLHFSPMSFMLLSDTKTSWPYIELFSLAL